MNPETPDLAILIKRLDATSRNMLEKASRFAQQISLYTVTPDHCLLQMLDENNSEVNKKLRQFDIDPIEWVKILLNKTARQRKGNKQNPLFSAELVKWIDITDTDGENLAISQSQLFNRLVSEAEIFGLNDLPGIDNPKILFGETEDITRVYAGDDKTTIINECSPQAQKREPDEKLEIPGYDIIEPVGKGGMASVYRARHLGLDRDVAIKVLTKNQVHADDFAARFLREARIVAKLAHPNVIQIYDINEASDQTYIAMEYIADGELTARLVNQIENSEIVRILSQILAALKAAHENDFIHRDIKPANILFRQDQSVVLTDFGIARVMSEDTDLTVAGSIVGTPKYMSPEQARGDRLDHRSDLYSVGVLFYELLEGKLPYKGESAMGTAMKHILDPLPEVSPKNVSLQPFIDRAMAKAVDDRFQSAQEMIEGLRNLAFEAPSPDFG